MRGKIYSSNFSFVTGEDDSGPIDGALASGDEEAAKNVNNVNIG